jgi:hypothetical protein
VTPETPTVETNVAARRVRVVRNPLDALPFWMPISSQTPV